MVIHRVLIASAVPGRFQVTGKAPKRIKPGTEITVSRYVPSEEKGAGDNLPMGIATTVGKASLGARLRHATATRTPFNRPKPVRCV